jgi:hypothetical protein
MAEIGDVIGEKTLPSKRSPLMRCPGLQSWCYFLWIFLAAVNELAETGLGKERERDGDVFRSWGVIALPCHRCLLHLHAQSTLSAISEFFWLLESRTGCSTLVFPFVLEFFLTDMENGCLIINPERIRGHDHWYFPFYVIRKQSCMSPSLNVKILRKKL